MGGCLPPVLHRLRKSEKMYSISRSFRSNNLKTWGFWQDMESWRGISSSFPLPIPDPAHSRHTCCIAILHGKTQNYKRSCGSIKRKKSCIKLWKKKGHVFSLGCQFTWASSLLLPVSRDPTFDTCPAFHLTIWVERRLVFWSLSCSYDQFISPGPTEKYGNVDHENVVNLKGDCSQDVGKFEIWGEEWRGGKGGKFEKKLRGFHEAQTGTTLLYAK